MTSLDQVTDGLYRVSTMDERVGMTFNQYLIVDDKPTLIHTGSVSVFHNALSRLREVIDPTRIVYVVISHFEADECGALSILRSISPEVVPITSQVTARQLAGFGISDNALIRQEKDSLVLGRRRLGFVTYPSEMHLWDGILPFEETARILFSSDLFIQRGPTPNPLVTANPLEVLNIPVRSIPADEPRAICLAKIKQLNPQMIALGHGPVLDLRGS